MHALPLPVLSERQLTSGIVGTGRQPPQASSAVQSAQEQLSLLGGAGRCWKVQEGARKCWKALEGARRRRHWKVLESAERRWKSGACMDWGL